MFQLVGVVFQDSEAKYHFLLYGVWLGAFVSVSVETIALYFSILALALDLSISTRGNFLVFFYTQGLRSKRLALAL